jgi:hypothetical protein
MTTDTYPVPPGDLDQLPWDDVPLGVMPDGTTMADPMPEPVEINEIETEPATEKPKRTRKPRAAKGEPVTTEALSGDVLPPEAEAEERALVRVQPPAQADHHIVTGMAALARMSNDDYEFAISSVIRGMERVRDFQQRAMTKGEDYGVVKGIDRPFLHLPGAEKLTLLYGLAARQEADVIIGQQVTVMDPETGAFVERWLSPPVAYHVRTYIHVGSFEGPIVAMGYGEANSWETKYRYTWEKPKCERCGKDLMKGGDSGKMAGKWFCPGFKGGCWWSVDVSKVPPPQRIDNPDPHSLRETLIQMAAKRSFVAATRRATGTSGLFTQDEDSPSVEAQADSAGAYEAPPDVQPVADAAPVERGAKVSAPTQAQINRLSQLSREKDLGPVNLAVYFNRVTKIPVEFKDVPDDRAAQSAVLLAAIQKATADQIGALINLLETGEVEPEPAEDLEAKHGSMADHAAH